MEKSAFIETYVSDRRFVTAKDRASLVRIFCLYVHEDYMGHHDERIRIAYGRIDYDGSAYLVLSEIASILDSFQALPEFNRFLVDVGSIELEGIKDLDIVNILVSQGKIPARAR